MFCAAFAVHRVINVTEELADDPTTDEIPRSSKLTPTTTRSYEFAVRWCARYAAHDPFVIDLISALWQIPYRMVDLAVDTSLEALREEKVHRRVPRIVRAALNSPKTRVRSPTTKSRPDLSGQRFGAWVVLAREGLRHKVRCDCGTERNVATYPLRNGISKSCGCKPRSLRKDLTGSASGSLTYIGEAGTNKSTTRYGQSERLIECRCACGKTLVVRAGNYIRKLSKSCGCSRRGAVMARTRKAAPAVAA